MSEVTGWLFDHYPHPQKGIMIWIIDEKGMPHSFHQDFEITFYAGGPFPRLRELWRFLQPRGVKLARVPSSLSERTRLRQVIKFHDEPKI